MLYFCVKILAQKDCILSVVLLAIMYFNNLRKRISNTAPSRNIVGFKQRYRRKQSVFLQIYFKTYSGGFKKIKGLVTFFKNGEKNLQSHSCRSYANTKPNDLNIQKQLSQMRSTLNHILNKENDTKKLYLFNTLNSSK